MPRARAGAHRLQEDRAGRARWRCARIAWMGSPRIGLGGRHIEADDGRQNPHPDVDERPADDGPVHRERATEAHASERERTAL